MPADRRGAGCEYRLTGQKWFFSAPMSDAFLILAPTSSIMPIADLAVEHRVYLALAAPVLLFVLAVEWAVRFIGSSRRTGLLTRPDGSGEPSYPSSRIEEANGRETNLEIDGQAVAAASAVNPDTMQQALHGSAKANEQIHAQTGVDAKVLDAAAHGDPAGLRHRSL